MYVYMNLYMLCKFRYVVFFVFTGALVSSRHLPCRTNAPRHGRTKKAPSLQGTSEDEEDIFICIYIYIYRCMCTGICIGICICICVYVD